jgi:hypothetical protein
MKTIGWRSLMGNRFISILLIFGLIAFWAACTDESDSNSPSSNASDKGKVGTFNPPIVACSADASKTTQTSITVVVTGGAVYGAPAGFSLQWVTKEVLDANGGVWPSEGYCKASFSGNANLHVYNLDPGESVEVTIGDILYDTPGASSDCIFDLECGTDYVFRAFAHATRDMFKSGWSDYDDWFCSTEACVENCVYGFGHWKNTGPEPQGIGNEYTWPQSVKDNGLKLGTVKTYTPLELQNILKEQGGANALVRLAHQLIAAKMNIANGADGSSIIDTIEDADELIGALIIPPTEASDDNLDNNVANPLKELLEAYNLGDGGVVYCAGQEEEEGD